MQSQLPIRIGQCATLACVWEATAAKPGNVHRGADFEDATYVDFLTSAALLGTVFDRANERTIGQLVLEGTTELHAHVGKNTYLGTILLLAPLAKAACLSTTSLFPDRLDRVLHGLTSDDARDVYEAIRRTAPGGLGRVEQGDVHGPAPEDLRQAMRWAAERDLVARQYTNRFHEVLWEAAPWIRDGVRAGWALEPAIVHAYLRLLSAHPDSLIARKCGAAVAQRAADQAAHVLGVGQPGDVAYQAALADFDFWLRSDGHRRNPGTTADLIAAGLFVLLVNGELAAGTRFYT